MKTPRGTIDKRPRDWRLALLVPLLLGGALRLYHASSWSQVYLPDVMREEGYYEAGMSWLSYRSLSLIPGTRPSAFRAPIYPAFIALVESVWRRPHPAHIRYAQVAVSLGDVALVFALASWIASPLAGLLAALWAAIDLEQVLGVSSLNVHGFYAFPILALAGALILWLERRDAKRGLLLGFALGVSLLTRSAHFPFPALLAGAYLFWWKFPETAATKLRRLALVAAATALTLSPMVARNWRQFHRFILLDTYKGSYLLLRCTTGPYLTTTVDQALDAAESLEPGFRARKLEGPAEYRALLGLAARNAGEHPFAYSWYCAQRLWLFWRGLWLPWLLTAAALWLRRGDRRLQAAALTAASFSGYAIAGGAPEYRASVVPILLVTAGCGLAELWRASTGTRASDGEVRPFLSAAFAALGVVYAAMLLLIGLELAWHHPGVPDDPRILADGRAEQVLRLGAVDENWDSPAIAESVAVSLQRAAALAALGDEAGARRQLQRARRDEGLVRDPAERAKLETIATFVDSSLARARPRIDDRGIAARRLIKDGRLNDALKLEDAMARSAAGRPQALARVLFERAQLLLTLGRTAAAQADLRGALAADAGGTDAPLVLAGLLNGQKRWTEALRVLDAAAGRTPEARAGLLALRCVILANAGRADESRRALEDALSLSPRGACAPPGLERSALPLPLLDACLARRPGDALLRVDRGVARYLARDAADAESDFRLALRENPGSLEAAMSLAVLLQASGRGEEELSVLNDALGRAGARRKEAIYAQALSLRDALQAPAR